MVAAYDGRGIKDVTVLAWAGDGGTVDIGLQALSGAAERGTNFIYVCYDNEAYGNTGFQRSGSSPFGSRTTTTPTGKREHKKYVPMIMAAHGIPYVATACISYPLDFVNKLRKAKTFVGTKYLQVLTPCPPGWRFSTEKTVEMDRLAVQTGIWRPRPISLLTGCFAVDFAGLSAAIEICGIVAHVRANNTHDSRCKRMLIYYPLGFAGLAFLANRGAESIGKAEETLRMF